VNAALKNCSSQIRCNIEFSFRFSQNLLTAITSVSFLSLRVVTHNGSNECSGEVGWVVKVSVTNLARQWPRVSVSLRAAHVLLVFCSLPAFLLAQTPSSDSPIPILSGSAGYFNFVAAGQISLTPKSILFCSFLWGIVGSRSPGQSLTERSIRHGHGGTISYALWHLQRALVSHLDPQLAAGSFDLATLGRIERRRDASWWTSGECPGELELCGLRFRNKHGA
jgi:hypothetical protein